MSDPEAGELGAAVPERVRRGLDEAPITPAYGTGLHAALALPGNILSRAADLRWARPVCICHHAAVGAGAAEDSDRTATVAAAVEVQMVALDLLDDIEDGESNPVLETYGLPTAVNISTGLIYLAQCMLLQLEDGSTMAGILAHAVLRATSGQHADLTLTTAMNLALDTSMDITARKSGSLMAAACRLGAAAAGAGEERQTLFARFGYLSGVVAQLANDIAALAPVASGKTDRPLRRPTLPLVYASRDRISAPCSGQPRPDCADGASHFAWAVAAAYRTLALDLVPAMTADAACHADLAHLLHPL